MYQPAAGGAPLYYWGEREGSGVTAESPSAPLSGFYTITADEPTPGRSSGGVYPGEPVEPVPVFRASTDQLDWLRLLALAVGVWIGAKLLK